MPENTTNPTQGGSYVRDPVTGQLEEQHRTKPATPELTSDPSTTSDAAPQSAGGDDQEA